MNTHDDQATSTTPAPGSSSAGAGFPSRVVLRVVSDPTVVRLLCGPRIREELLATTALDDLESGGFLYASTTGSMTELVVASGAGDGARRTSHALQIERAYIEGLERDLRRSSPDLIAVGTWHTHGDHDAAPSDIDLRAWAAGLELLEERAGPGVAFVGVIATTPSWARGDWGYPELFGFVTRRDSITGEITCENAKVEEVD